MDTPQRIKKQFKIALVYLAIFLIIVGGIYLKILLSQPTCSDGIQNQGETGIDCGGPCLPCPWQLQEDLEVIFTKAILTQGDYLDLMAKINNPNRNFGAKSFSYVFELYDSQDSLILSRQGTSYILPGEIGYVIAQKVLVESKVFDIELKIINVDWEGLIEYEEPELLIKKLEFQQSEDFSKAYGTLENRSNYDFGEIDIWAILFDEKSNILAVGKTDIRTVLSRENRYFEISWFFPMEDRIDKVDVMAKTNVFLDENFMKRYEGEKEKFQEY